MSRNHPAFSPNYAAVSSGALNRSSSIVSLGKSNAQIFHWNYDAHLADNVPHRHTYFEVCRVGRYGQGYFIVEGHRHEILPGYVFIARPGVIHQIINTAKPLMELSWVSYSWPFIEGSPGALPRAAMAEPEDEATALLRAFAASPVTVIPDEAGYIAILWQALEMVAAEPRPAQEMQLSGLMASLLLAIAQGAAGTLAPAVAPTAFATDSGDSLARLAVRYAHDNLDRPLSVNEIASYVHVSPRHLSRLWRRFTGASPAAYIERARLDRAAALLLQDDSSIKEVALKLGYEDVHHFTRAFRRCFACPPGAYRRRYSNDEKATVARRAVDVPNVHKPGALV